LAQHSDVNHPALRIEYTAAALLMSGFPTRLIESLQYLFRPRPDGGVSRQIHPADGAGGVNQEFCRPGDICSFGSPARVQKIVAPNHFGFGVGKDGISEAHPLTMPLVYVRRVHADSDDANAARIKVRKPLLKTPQLGVA
jgi:hypothetical protein